MREYTRSNMQILIELNKLTIISAASHRSITTFQVKMFFTFMWHRNAVTLHFLCSRVQWEQRNAIVAQYSYERTFSPQNSHKGLDTVMVRTWRFLFHHGRRIHCPIEKLPIDEGEPRLKKIKKYKTKGAIQSDFNLFFFIFKLSTLPFSYELLKVCIDPGID